MVPPHEWQRLRESSTGTPEASMVYHLYATGPLTLLAPMNSMAE
jgi:hypothetical protein